MRENSVSAILKKKAIHLCQCAAEPPVHEHCRGKERGKINLPLLVLICTGRDHAKSSLAQIGRIPKCHPKERQD